MYKRKECVETKEKQNEKEEMESRCGDLEKDKARE
jgi:hypothetical protein